MEMDFSLDRSNLRPRRSRHRYWDLGWPEKLTLVIIAIGACLASLSFIIYSAMLPILPHGPEIRADVPSFRRLCLWTIEEVCNGRTVDVSCGPAEFPLSAPTLTSSALQHQQHHLDSAFSSRTHATKRGIIISVASGPTVPKYSDMVTSSWASA